jgi:hypothetical protein
LLNVHSSQSSSCPNCPFEFIEGHNLACSELAKTLLSSVHFSTLCRQ